MSKEEIIKEIEAKYAGLGEKAETYLKGLLHAKAVNYWDYIEVDTLLSLQKPKTHFKDESIFIMYHQITELVLKMMLHEIEQLVEEPFDEKVWMVKCERLNRYTSMLINSFDVMKYGMDYDDYNTFRSTLAPASGFQSVQFRKIELHCTRLENLLNEAGKKRLVLPATTSDYFEHIYWKDAGINRETGDKSVTLREFEQRYLDGLIGLADKMEGKTLEDKIRAASTCSSELKEKLKEFDHLYNVAWPLVHLKTAQYYLDLKGENKAATGGSEWKKYLHPKFQQRKFFPSLWDKDEIENWGNQKV